MKKIYLVIAGILLFILIITSILLSLIKKLPSNPQQNSPFPTSIPNQGNRNNNTLPQTTLSPDIQNNTVIDISSIAPVETNDFKLQYSPQLDKIVVERKTPLAGAEFINWATENNYPQLIDDPDKVILLDPGQGVPDPNPLLKFLDIFMNFGQGNIISPPSPTPTIKSSNSSLRPSSIPKPSSSGFSYFPQCGDLGNISLPDGCNLCEAGCGPTTVSMIASSYLGDKYDPQNIVDLYQSKGYLLGCSGSRYSDAYSTLQNLGLKTTNYLIFNSERSDTVVPDLKKYINSGWTFFTLASFCDGGCGHYFWITDIDSQGNILAYDPAYGRYQIPYNENSRYPYPLYRLAFGVKK